jgi:hypothetical protein
MALSYIYLKLQGRLKSITISGNTGVLVCGKYTNRLVVNLNQELTKDWVNEKNILEVDYNLYFYCSIILIILLYIY